MRNTVKFNIQQRKDDTEFTLTEPNRGKLYIPDEVLWDIITMTDMINKIELLYSDTEENDVEANNNVEYTIDVMGGMKLLNIFDDSNCIAKLWLPIVCDEKLFAYHVHRYYEEIARKSKIKIAKLNKNGIYVI